MNRVSPDDPGVGPGVAPATTVTVRKGSAIDWLCGAMLLAWGLSFAAPGDTLASSPAYAGLAEKAPEAAWAVALIVVGLARFGALVVNGLLPRGSPVLRGAAAFLGVLIWGLFLSGFIAVSWRMWVISAGVGVNLVMLGGDIFCCGRAAADAMRAHDVHRG
jgi:hypothetical protein